jgi:uncharacterized delta-60 repeat protein
MTMDTYRFDARRHTAWLVKRLGLALVLAAVLAGNVWSAAGDLDLTFGSSGTGAVITEVGFNTSDEALAVALQPDGKIVTAGYSTAGGKRVFAVVRHDDTGTRDSGFGSDGIVTTTIGISNSVAYAAALQSDGNIILAGSSVSGGKTTIALARYISTTGALDPAFGVGGVVTTSLSTGSDVARGMAIQPDGRIVVGGNASGQLAVARYNSDGTPDTSFGTGGTATLVLSATVGNAVAIQPDGKIVLAGYSDKDGTDDFAVVRFMVTGTLDTSWNRPYGWVLTDFGGSSEDQGRAVAVQPDGKIVVAGSTTSGVGHPQFAAARYNASGSEDAMFGVNGRVRVAFGAAEDRANALAIQPTGRIVLTGFTAAGSVNYLALVRYTRTGALDTSFGVNGLATTSLASNDNLLYAAASQPDGKIVAAGSVDEGTASRLDFALVRYQSPNRPPTVTNFIKTSVVTGSINLSESDFATPFEDADGDVLAKVKVESLPAHGVLSLRGAPVTPTQEIWAFDLGHLTYTPTLSWSGDDPWAWNGSDGQDYALTGAVVTMTVLLINQPPSFTQGADQRVRVSSGPLTVTHWATNISAGAPNEANQVLTFTLTASKPSIFAAQPAVNAATGDLTFQPSHVSGSSVVTVTLHDSGGTANGGVDTSPPQTFTITVIPYTVYLPVVLR